MNKFLLAATAVIMAISVAAPAAAAVNARQIAQRNSIDAGIRSGKINHREAFKLRTEQNLITRAKLRMKGHHGGHLSAADNKRIHDMQDAAARHIDRLKNNSVRGHGTRILGKKIL